MSSSTKVAVSGITGFVGAQVAADLLVRGYVVHGTVRRNTPEKIAHLTSLPDNPGTLHVFEADLTTPGSFDAAVAGCDYAIHIASPFASNVADPQKELVDPAVNGTLNFLRSCKAAAVKKVVLTSSLAAVADGGASGTPVDENDWNVRSSLKVLPYYYSKVLAEKAAWKFVEEEAPEMKLVVINPVLVIGPSLVKSLNETAKLMVAIMKGTFGGVLDLTFPFVDVRDVSEAHIEAMESDVAQGRYICVADRLVAMREVCNIAQSKGFEPPMRDLTGKIVSTIIKLVSHVVPGGDDGQYVRNHLGNPIIPKNEKIVKDLGLKLRDPVDTINDTVDSLVKFGHLEAPPSSDS